LLELSKDTSFFMAKIAWVRYGKEGPKRGIIQGMGVHDHSERRGAVESVFVLFSLPCLVKTAKVAPSGDGAGDYRPEGGGRQGDRACQDSPAGCGHRGQ
jgi:hypothetical protein